MIRHLFFGIGFVLTMHSAIAGEGVRAAMLQLGASRSTSCLRLARNEHPDKVQAYFAWTDCLDKQEIDTTHATHNEKYIQAGSDFATRLLFAQEFNDAAGIDGGTYGELTKKGIIEGYQWALAFLGTEGMTRSSICKEIQ